MYVLFRSKLLIFFKSKEVDVFVVEGVMSLSGALAVQAELEEVSNTPSFDVQHQAETMDCDDGSH